MPFQSYWKILGPHIAPRRKRSWNEIYIYASLLKVILSIIENYARLRVFIQKRYTFAPLVNFVSTRVLETRIWTNESTRVHTHTHTGARTRPTASRWWEPSYWVSINSSQLEPRGNLFRKDRMGFSCPRIFYVLRICMNWYVKQKSAKKTYQNPSNSASK